MSGTGPSHFNAWPSFILEIVLWGIRLFSQEEIEILSSPCNQLGKCWNSELRCVTPEFIIVNS